MTSLEDDIRIREEHQRKLELLKAQDPKVEKIRAKTQLKIARAQSASYNKSRMFKYAAVAAAVVLLGVSSCSASVYGFGFRKDYDLQKQDMYNACVQAGGSWDNSNKDCDQ